MTSESDTGIIFECRTCGDCCRGFGGNRLSEADVRQVAAYLGIDRQAFVEKYCVVLGRRMYLAQKSDGFCVFHDGLCTIHPVKPSMCRRWPFIDAVLVDVRNWRVMAAVCPGMRADVSDDVIRDRVAREIENDRQRPSRDAG